MKPKFLVLLLVLVYAGCASKPPGSTKYSWELYSSPAVTASAFSGQSVAILPAATIVFDPNQEVYRETIAGLLYTALQTNQHGPRLIPVDMVQSRINAAGLWDDFLHMYRDYNSTALLRKDLLVKIGQACGARYALLPKLLRYQQEVFDRATILGISFLKTRQSTVDIHVQIWDTETGAVVWQGAGEGTEATEFVSGSPISFLPVAQRACESLIWRMPWAVPPVPPAQQVPAPQKVQTLPWSPPFAD